MRGRGRGENNQCSLLRGLCQTTYWADHPYVLYFPIAASQQSSQTPFHASLVYLHPSQKARHTVDGTNGTQGEQNKDGRGEKTHAVACLVPKHGSGSINCLCCLIDTTLRRRHLSVVDKVLVGSSLMGLQLLQSLPDKGR